MPVRQVYHPAFILRPLVIVGGEALWSGRERLLCAWLHSRTSSISMRFLHSMIGAAAMAGLFLIIRNGQLWIDSEFNFSARLLIVADIKRKIEYILFFPEWNLKWNGIGDFWSDSWTVVCEKIEFRYIGSTQADIGEKKTFCVPNASTIHIEIKWRQNMACQCRLVWLQILNDIAI